MSWVALGAAAVGAVGSVVAAKQGKASAPAAVPYAPVDLQDQQRKAIQGNIAEQPSLDELLSQSNTFQQEQASSMMEKALPGYGKFASNLTRTATDLAANPYQVPKSVVDQLSQYAAENNISAGTGASSGFSQSNLLRSLGVNALQYGQSNLAAATSALSVLTGTAPRTSPMSPLSFLVTPAMSGSNQQVTNQLQQQIGQGAANAATQTNNSNSANLWDTVASQVSSIAANPAVQQGIAGMFSGGAGSADTSKGSGLSPAPISFGGK